MKGLLAFFAGLMISASLAYLGGCGALCDSNSTLTPGTYVLDPERLDKDFQPIDYQLTVPVDLSSIEERFTLGGKRYVMTYRVTARTHE